MAAPIISTTPTPSRLQELGRLSRLLNAAERDIQTTFLRLIGGARGMRTLTQITDLIERGRPLEALDMFDDVAGGLSSSIEASYLAAGQSTANVLANSTNSILEFNSLNARSSNYLRDQRAQVLNSLVNTQRDATLEAIAGGVRRGRRPDQIARDVRRGIGLTAAQERAAQNYRRLLEEGNSQALTRRLRDRRFDPTVRRAIRDGAELTTAQLDRMEQRYRERALKHRAETIANTEGLAAVHAADDEMWQQATDRGLVELTLFTDQWHTARDERVRDSHRFMNGQKRPVGTPFTSGNANSLRYPGDHRAPLSDTIRCRCIRSRDIDEPG